LLPGNEGANDVAEGDTRLDGSNYAHVPVLRERVLALLAPAPDTLSIDMTVGLGGHATALLEATGPHGRLLGLDRDATAIAAARARLAPYGARVVIAHAAFADVAEVAGRHGFSRVQSVLCDLGVSSPQLDVTERGFSARQDGPLDMRMDQRQGITAADVVNAWSEADLIYILREFGEEPLARQVATAVCRRRARARIETTAELAGLVAGVYARKGWRRSRLHPATRTFQAVRIAVNDEFTQLRAGLEGALRVLAPGGRLAAISFHSGEDRIVKQFMKTHSAKGGCGVRVVKKPVTASAEECRENPRARSAKLRVFERTGEGRDEDTTAT
jgi:16S rRNA (cytosine1402-N4)-methyltransferase